MARDCIDVARLLAASDAPTRILGALVLFGRTVLYAALAGLLTGLILLAVLVLLP